MKRRDTDPFTEASKTVMGGAAGGAVAQLLYGTQNMVLALVVSLILLLLIYLFFYWLEHHDDILDRFFEPSRDSSDVAREVRPSNQLRHRIRRADQPSQPPGSGAS